MADGSERRGAKPLSDRDWIFGSRPRRKLIEGVLTRAAPEGGWTRPELSQIAGVVANGGVDEHVRGLERLGVLSAAHSAPRTWRPVRPPPPLAKALRNVLNALDNASDSVVRPPARDESQSSKQGVLKSLRMVEIAARRAREDLGEQAVADFLSLLDDARRRLDV